MFVWAYVRQYAQTATMVLLYHTTCFSSLSLSPPKGELFLLLPHQQSKQRTHSSLQSKGKKKVLLKKSHPSFSNERCTIWAQNLQATFSCNKYRNVQYVVILPSLLMVCVAECGVSREVLGILYADGLCLCLVCAQLFYHSCTATPHLLYRTCTGMYLYSPTYLANMIRVAEKHIVCYNAM